MRARKIFWPCISTAGVNFLLSSRVAAGFGEDTLIEAIAVELERSHGFVYISDERLTAAVNVSTDDDENFLIATSEDELTAVGGGADYRGVFAEYADEDDVRND